MRRLGDTIARLRPKMPAMPLGMPAAGRLVALPAGADNPGALTGWAHVPAGHRAMPLVVVLHGCTQTAAGYDHGAGWSAMADRHGFAVLFPEQTRANNPNLCFNWFAPGDNRRDAGEARSIRAMIAQMLDSYPIDPARVYVTGLSAGGAMTSIMLASYPEVFAGGAIIAGLPHGAAGNVSQALDRMRGHGHVGADAYAALVRDASPHAGPWPSVSVWHGTGDTTVTAGNADAILDQWRGVHGLRAAPDREERIDGATRRRWLGADGRVLVEDYRIPGMGHGTPLRTEGETASGAAGPHMLDVGISSTWHIAEAWGLIDRAAAAAQPARDQTTNDRATPTRATLIPTSAPTPAPTPATGIEATITAALRSAGLMR